MNDRQTLAEVIGEPHMRRVERDTLRARRSADGLADVDLFDLRNLTRTDWRLHVIDTLLQQRGYDLT